MQDQDKQIGLILAKYPDLSDDEMAILSKWLEIEDNRSQFTRLTNEDYRAEKLAKLFEYSLENEQFLNKMQLDDVQPDESSQTTAGGLRVWQRYIVAASIVITILAGAAVWYNSNKVRELSGTVKNEVSHDVMPGQYKAKLTLADGSEILLDSNGTGQLITQGTARLVNENGVLKYVPGKEKSEIVYNTLSTTAGQTYATVLSDGTKVFLNSLSSLTYPVTFDGAIRVVNITGEAYFEVSSLSTTKGKKPFVVNVNGMQVHVVGTHFNINAYPDEATITTTLIEGEVNVKAGGTAVSLAAGEQTKLERSTSILSKTDNVDVDRAVAWRFGYFQFRKSNLEDILRQLARWYNLKVVYQGKVKPESFSGEIPRSEKLSTVLEILGTNGVGFEIRGNELIVTP
jgi:Fe2+-dicitrate sensor, membrane component